MKKVLFGIITTTLLHSCMVNHNKISVRNGDLIFVEAETENLSGAISRVTKDKNAMVSFDHIALIEIDGKRQFVLESTTQKGSHKEALNSYLKRSKKENKKLYLYRLKKEYSSCIPSAISKANKMIGKPYNYTYIQNENEYYCSDFIERAFRDCSIFELQRMSFVNPKTKKTDEYWVQYYHKFNAKIPEGELGCNPNGLSQSNKIYRIGILK